MDLMDVEILEDGTISVKTSDISEANHYSADELLEEIAELTGGTRLRSPREHDYFKRHKVLRHGKIVKRSS